MYSGIFCKLVSYVSIPYQQSDNFSSTHSSESLFFIFFNYAVEIWTISNKTAIVSHQFFFILAHGKKTQKHLTFCSRKISPDLSFSVFFLSICRSYQYFFFSILFQSKKNYYSACVNTSWFSPIQHLLIKQVDSQGKIYITRRRVNIASVSGRKLS